MEKRSTISPYTQWIIGILVLLAIWSAPPQALGQGGINLSEYSTLGKNPTVVGGEKELTRMLKYHLHIPDSLNEKKTIHVVCTVDADAHSHNYYIQSSDCPSLNQEALRVAQLLTWEPGKDKITNTPVTAKAAIALVFSPGARKKNAKLKQMWPSLPVQAADSSLDLCPKPDSIPEFIAGKDSLNRYLKKKLSYPEEAKIKNLQGTVVVEFIVEKNGFLSNLHIKEGLGGGCNEEALEIIGHTKWIPARQKGKYVRYKMTFPIVFKLDGGLNSHTSGDINQR